MAGFDTSIQALLRDLNSGHEQDEYEISALPYPKQCPISSRPQRAQSFQHSRQGESPTYNEQLLCTDQAPGLSSTYLYNGNNGDGGGLDRFGEHLERGICSGSANTDLDRTLLADPAPRPSCRPRGGRQGASVGRLTLPGHTAPFSIAESIGQRKPQPMERGQ